VGTAVVGCDVVGIAVVGFDVLAPLLLYLLLWALGFLEHKLDDKRECETVNLAA
jgi:hypothetical protein